MKTYLAERDEKNILQSDEIGEGLYRRKTLKIQFNFSGFIINKYYMFLNDKINTISRCHGLISYFAPRGRESPFGERLPEGSNQRIDVILMT